jgi:hypothetical protein
MSCTSVGGVSGGSDRTIHGPVADVALGWCWLPVAGLMLLLRDHVGATQTAMVAAFLISFAHQPLTLALVYGDRRQVSAHRKMYRWAPLVAVVAITLGWTISFTTVAVIAALWNAEHTLMQRYGVMRIYGRKNGDDHGRLEKPAMIAMLVAGVASIAAFADREAIIRRLGLGRANASGVRALDHLAGPATAVFWLATAAAALLAAAWIARERRAGGSRPKAVYAAGTVGLVAMVVVDPVAGIAGYVVAHAIEYFAIVHVSLRRRTDAEPVARLTRTPGRRSTVYAGYFALIAGMVLAARRIPNGYSALILVFGLLHVLYDGFVWKLRRPAVAASLGIPGTADRSALTPAS